MAIPNEEGEYEGRKDFLRKYRLPTVEQLIAGRKGMWIAHAKRCEDTLTLQLFKDAEEENDDWWRSLKRELGWLNTTPEAIREIYDLKAAIRRVFHPEGDDASDKNESR